MSAIRLYIEGGGDDRHGKRKLRAGFSGFLHDIVALCRARRVRFDVILCGGRQSTYEDFCAALRIHRDALSILLVDAEAPVAFAGRPWEHLKRRDGWDRPDGTSDAQGHLMAQVMESWLLADPEALAAFYGQGFLRSALPAHRDVEQIAKEHIEPALKRATQSSKTKGEYHKIWHAAELLQRIDVERVQSRAEHCKRLFATLRSLIESGS